MFTVRNQAVVAAPFLQTEFFRNIARTFREFGVIAWPHLLLHSFPVQFRDHRLDYAIVLHAAKESFQTPRDGQLQTAFQLVFCFDPVLCFVRKNCRVVFLMFRCRRMLRTSPWPSWTFHVRSGAASVCWHEL
jgi:hypothetical protein